MILESFVYHHRLRQLFLVVWILGFAWPRWLSIIKFKTPIYTHTRFSKINYLFTCTSYKSFKGFIAVQWYTLLLKYFNTILSKWFYSILDKPMRVIRFNTKSNILNNKKSYILINFFDNILFMLLENDYLFK